MFASIEDGLTQAPSQSRLHYTWRLETHLSGRLCARVVKGQCADLNEPDMDMRAGFLRVIDELARARTLPLSRVTICPLRNKRRGTCPSTRFELALLHGLPWRAAVKWHGRFVCQSDSVCREAQALASLPSEARPEKCSCARLVPARSSPRLHNVSPRLICIKAAKTAVGC